jgi:DNA-binding LytR/AlgR family response regulator
MAYQTIKVIICDDDKNIRNQIYNYLEEFESSNYCKFDINTFESAEEMMKTAALEDCELLFLDIEMGALNGIEASHIIRDQQDRVELQIIFISAYDRYMKEMFEVRPFNYLSKPLTKERFNETLEKFIRLHKKNSTYFTFNTGRNLYRLSYKEILYFESSKRKIIVHTKDGTSDFYGKLDELVVDLKENSFFRIHQSYLVNPMHIKFYSSQSVTLVNGLEIPISAKYRRAFLNMQITQ